MSKPNRGGFTLVEMLVVIAIIGLLVALLTPAVIAARERARQAQCTNNQKNLSSGVTQHELARRQFPGYASRTAWPVGQTPPEASWHVAILNDLDRGDLWDEWRRGNAAALLNMRVNPFLCPSDSRTEAAATSYVANCGQADDVLDIEDPYTDYVGKMPPDWNANGVFHRYYSHPSRNPGRPVMTTPMTMSDIKDGAQHTLLLSENVQAGEWISSTAPTLVEERFVGMVMCPHVEDSGHVHDVVHGGINVGLDVDATDAAEWPKLMYARPASHHPGGVIVAYCDGHTQFLSQQVNYLVYQLLITPDGAKMKVFEGGAWTKEPQTTKLTDDMLTP